MPPLATEFAARISPAIHIATIAEELRVDPNIGKGVRARLTAYRCRLIYELAYLRLFGIWEQFLEDILLRYVCGYTFGNFANVVRNGPTPTLVAGKARLLANRDYVLLHNPGTVLSHLNRLFQPGDFYQVVQSFQQPLEDFAAIRHRIAHTHEDARQKFDDTCIDLVTKRFPGSRPGFLLREWTTFGGLNVRWLDRIGKELTNIAYQLAP